MDGSETAIWGNLANTSMGACYVETVTPVKTRVDVEIGLWVRNGKIWVKGLILNGIVIESNCCFGVRVGFDLEGGQRESLKQFLKFVESSTKSSTRASTATCKSFKGSSDHPAALSDCGTLSVPEKN